MLDDEDAAKLARSSYPKLWTDGDMLSSKSGNTETTNLPSKKMPRSIPSNTEHSFHWARSVPNTSLPSSGLKFTVTTNDEPFIVRFNMIVSRSLVIAQQFSLSTLFLVGNRCAIYRVPVDLDEKICAPCHHDDNIVFAMRIFTFTMVIMAVSTMIARRQNEGTQMQVQRKRDRFHSRSVDAILIAGILRFLSSVLRTLTASYSSDTVTALAIGGMVLHVVSADYNYANGISEKAELQQKTVPYAEKRRPMFLGGTVSINCVFFSAALLASRLPSDTVSYVSFMWTVILFAYYPEARFLVAHTSFGRIGECFTL